MLRLCRPRVGFRKRVRKQHIWRCCHAGRAVIGSHRARGNDQPLQQSATETTPAWRGKADQLEAQETQHHWWKFQKYSEKPSKEPTRLKCSHFYQYALSPAIPKKLSVGEENICFSSLNPSEHFLGLIIKNMVSWLNQNNRVVFFSQGEQHTPHRKLQADPVPHPPPRHHPPADILWPLTAVRPPRFCTSCNTCYYVKSKK